MQTQNPNSLEAYKNMQPKIPTDENLILSVLDNKIDYTYKEIGNRIYKKLLLNKDNEARLKAFAWKYDPNKVSGRMRVLVRLKKVKIIGTRICSFAGSNCSAYVLI